MGTIYIATEDGVGPEETMDLLNEMSAIWCPPPKLRCWSGTPTGGDKCILAYKRDDFMILGSGFIEENTREVAGTNVLWTEADIPGVRLRAEELGYRGPNNMMFLRLNDVKTRNVAINENDAQPLSELAPGVNVVDEKDKRYFALFKVI